MGFVHKGPVTDGNMVCLSRISTTWCIHAGCIVSKNATVDSEVEWYLIINLATVKVGEPHLF